MNTTTEALAPVPRLADVRDVGDYALITDRILSHARRVEDVLRHYAHIGRQHNEGKFAEIVAADAMWELSAAARKVARTGIVLDQWREPSRMNPAEVSWLLAMATTDLAVKAGSGVAQRPAPPGITAQVVVAQMLQTAQHVREWSDAVTDDQAARRLADACGALAIAGGQLESAEIDRDTWPDSGLLTETAGALCQLADEVDAAVDERWQQDTIASLTDAQVVLVKPECQRRKWVDITWSEWRAVEGVAAVAFERQEFAGYQYVLPTAAAAAAARGCLADLLGSEV